VILQEISSVMNEIGCKQWLTFAGYVVMCSLAIIANGTFLSEAQTVPNQEGNRSFFEQQGCPLHAVKTNGASLELHNSSPKSIVNWGEACLRRSGNRYDVLQTFHIDDPFVKTNGFTYDVIALDATPLNVCRAAGGQIAVSEVVFEDGTRWRSRWNKGAPLPIPSGPK
jgi:hypothetical protein